jgi:tetratricopeptide (TPR) repeat protein
MYLFAIIRARKAPAISSALAVMAVLAALSLHNWFHARLPTFARDYFFKSLAEFDKGHFEPALADIDRSVSLDPTDVNAAVHQGNVLFALGRLDEARNAYERATKINPNEPSAWTNLGNVLDAQGKTDEALQAFSNAMHCTPPSRNAFLGTAYIQIRRGQLDAATKTLDELQAVTGGQNVLALAARSVIERRRGNIQAAGELEQQVNRLDSSAISWVLKQIEGKDSNSSGK